MAAKEITNKAMGKYFEKEVINFFKKTDETKEMKIEQLKAIIRLEMDIPSGHDDPRLQEIGKRAYLFMKALTYTLLVCVLLLAESIYELLTKLL